MTAKISEWGEGCNNQPEINSTSLPHVDLGAAAALGKV